VDPAPKILRVRGNKLTACIVKILEEGAVSDRLNMMDKTSRRCHRVDVSLNAMRRSGLEFNE
jgi:hypothetical protein